MKAAKRGVLEGTAIFSSHLVAREVGYAMACLLAAVTLVVSGSPTRCSGASAAAYLIAAGLCLASAVIALVASSARPDSGTGSDEAG